MGMLMCLFSLLYFCTLKRPPRYLIVSLVYFSEYSAITLPLQSPITHLLLIVTCLVLCLHEYS